MANLRKLTESDGILTDRTKDAHGAAWYDPSHISAGCLLLIGYL